jgi:hypothetical protein
MDSQSILPTFDVFSQDVPAGAMTQAAAGTGAVGKSRFFALSPVVAAIRGLGDAPADTGTGVPVDTKMTSADMAWMLAILGVAGALSYQAGKAIAPSRQDATTWGWIGVPVGLFTGVLGLGVMGIVANKRKG